MEDELVSKRIRLDTDSEQFFQNFNLERFQKQAIFSRLCAYKELCKVLENEKTEILSRELGEGNSNRF